MTLILRRVTKPRWLKDDENLLWLARDEPQADALKDLGTRGNKLSVWLVADDKTNLNDVVVALISTGGLVSHFDYVLVEYNVLEKLGVRIENAEGETPYEQANKWHTNLSELSAVKLLQLAREVQSGNPPARILEQVTKQLLINAIKDGKIKIDQIPKPELKTWVKAEIENLNRASQQ